MRKHFTIICAIIILCIAAAGCGGGSGKKENSGNESTAADRIIPYRFASKEEGIKLKMANEAYFDGFSKNDLEFKMQKKNVDLDEYKAYVKKQVRDFTDDEKATIDNYMSKVEQKITDSGYHLPDLDEIVFICTTMKEELGAGGYTHGTQIYIGKHMIKPYIEKEVDGSGFEYILAHELFHCLTRSSPAFRADMYKIIHFNVQEDEYVIPPSAKEYFISNPDVEHHNAYAEFIIDGKPVDCFMAAVTKKHFEKKGDQFFDTVTGALVPVDGRDMYYFPEDASNFNDLLGKNTGYTLDPEECMADNFAFTIVFGEDGPDGKGYPTPEIINEIREYLKK